ncbi:antitoxin VbhA family protein [Arthrobacter pigmenti]
MATEFNVEDRWPELFAGLTPDDRRYVLNALASIWYEGWKPNREDVGNLTDYARGSIDRAEYSRRVHMAAARDKAYRANPPRAIRLIPSYESLPYSFG